MANQTLITITGINNYYGKKPFEIGRTVKLAKEPNNRHDSEAIVVTLPYIEKIGYVANSIHTVYEGSCSAGRLYDQFERFAYAEVLIVTHSSVVARLLSDDEVKEKF